VAFIPALKTVTVHRQTCLLICRTMNDVVPLVRGFRVRVEAMFDVRAEGRGRDFVHVSVMLNICSKFPRQS
jgi:hypothetical protein